MKSSILSSVIVLSQHALAWDYHDMDHWSDDYPMCGTNDQSPINIDPKSVTYDESICTAEFHWDFKMPMVEVFKVKNTGHSISLTPVKQIEYYDGAEDDGALLVANSVNFTTYRELKYSDDAIATFDNNFLPTGSEHTKFCLDSLHFHWGTTSDTGSEHLIDDHQYPLEVHFVHYSCQHNDLGLTLAQFPDLEDVESAKEEGEDVHQLGVIGFFFEISEEDNPAFDLLFSDDRMDRIELPLNASEELTELDIVHGFNLGDIIPVDYVSAGYYAYEGSLTTPPCTNIGRYTYTFCDFYKSITQSVVYLYSSMACNECQTNDIRGSVGKISRAYGR